MLLFVALVLLLNQGCSGWSLKSWYFCRSAGIACLYHLASVPFWQSKEASSQFSYVMFWFIFVPETSTCTVIDDQSLLNSQCYKNITFPPESFVYASLQNNPPKAEFKTGAGPCDLCIMLFRSVPCQMINHNYQLPQRLQYRQQSPPEFRGSVKSHQRGALPKCAPPPFAKGHFFPWEHWRRMSGQKRPWADTGHVYRGCPGSSVFNSLNCRTEAAEWWVLKQQAGIQSQGSWACILKACL